MTRLQGKATLTGHPDPNRTRDDLRHMGFHGLRDSPVMGRDIPEFFRLEKTGTGVFIMGFNPHSSDRVDEIATAAIENFFHAVHHRNLAVAVKPADGSPIRMDHRTIDCLFERLKPSNRNAALWNRVPWQPQPATTPGAV